MRAAKCYFSINGLNKICVSHILNALLIYIVYFLYQFCTFYNGIIRLWRIVCIPGLMIKIPFHRNCLFSIFRYNRRIIRSRESHAEWVFEYSAGVRFNPCKFTLVGAWASRNISHMRYWLFHELLFRGLEITSVHFRIVTRNYLIP